MPRTVVYRRNAVEQHYTALLAGEPNPPSPQRRGQLEEEAQELAKTVSPESARLHFVAELAEHDRALEALDQGDISWRSAATQAADGAPLPQGTEAAAKTVSTSEPTSTDGYLEKLAKYVPAESITLTTLAFAALTPSSGAVWWLVAGGAVANVVYLYGTALAGRAEAPMPRWYFYLLSALALVLWSIAIIGVVGTKAGIESTNADAAKTFVLAAAAFLVPLLDGIFTAWTEMYEDRKAKPKAQPEGGGAAQLSA